MQPIEIDLTFNKTHFEEIYFANHQANIFRSESTKKHFLLLLIFMTALATMLVIAIYTNTFNFGSVVLLLITTIVAFNFIRRAAHLLHWKKAVEKHLNDIEKHRRYKIILTESAITVMLNEEKFIEQWTAIKGATITNDYISLDASHNHLFPRKAMTEKEYAILKAFISNKINKEP